MDSECMGIPVEALAVGAAIAAIDGAELLNDVHEFTGRYIAFPHEYAHVAHTLWVMHAHLMDAWESTPRLAALSPEPSCGKTRVLEVSETLVPRPVEAVNVTPAYLFRKVDDPDGRPTILYDEIDTVFGPKAKDNEEIRGLLNAGHRQGAVAGRCTTHGKKVETEEIPAYCAVALAGIGNLPDTIMTRSVIMKMRRRAPNEKVEPWRRRLCAPVGERLRERLARWADQIIDQVTDTFPDMPDGVMDRPADVWEPLLAVADAAGGDWPERGREACVMMVEEAQTKAPSLGVRLLADLRDIFGDQDKMFTVNILSDLIDIEEAPWDDLYGKSIDPRKLARLLEPYGVHPKDLRINEKILKGYLREDLWESWQRYLPNEDE